MNSTADRTVEVQRPRHGIYFFLSYAHSAPTSEMVRSDADPSVGVFFVDLVAAVAARARPAEGMEIGFFDQQIPPGADMKAQLCDSLSRAEVFVPLYSPGYFAKSWPTREQEVFRRRLRSASAVAPDRHIVPILWTPFRSWETPIVARELSIGASISEYCENGLRALCMLASYQHSYQRVLAGLAEEIVTVAEGSTLGPSAAPDLDDVPRPERTAQAGFLVAILAPKHSLPDAPQALKSGENPWWRTYAGRRIPPVAEHAGSVAERLGLDTQVADFVEVEELFDWTPAIVFVDPWMVVSRGPEFLASTFAGLQDWVVPLVLDAHSGNSDVDPASALTEKAVAALENLRGVPVNRVAGMDKLEEILPTVIAKARRTYLRQGPVFPPAGSAKRPARLRDAGTPNTTGNKTRE